ncbi:CHAT domain-containing protein [Mesorhizobium sp. NZP2298]|uniref:CHAT domain-containing protein n=1 Tax=Mesorhizobium sp. NZP2298 TaxID=2483403 RepID=UPI0015565DCF|nr:CHAT domain-containing protein [Mesorhizobium sp. NZP2298]
MLQLSNLIFSIEIRVSTSGLSVTGTVVSESGKRAIEQILQDFRPGRPIDSHLIVTAPFRSAEDPDIGDPRFGSHRLDAKLDKTDGPAKASLVTVNRFPVIRSAEKLLEGKRFKFEVDLSLQPDAGTSGDEVSLSDVASDWTTLTIDVEVFSTGLSFDPGTNRKQIAITRGAGSVPATFDAAVTIASLDGGTPMEVVAMFNYRGRFSGIARKSFEVSSADPEPAHATGQSALDPPFGTIAFVPSAEAPDLTIKILEGGDPGVYIWSLDAPRGQGLGPSSWSASVNLGQSTGVFALGLMKDCPKLRPGAHTSVLQGIGESIWAVSPKAFQELYRDLRKKFGPSFPIQLVTDEPYVPWEMMFPDDQAGIDQPDHLFMTHPMSRWFLQSEGRMRDSFAAGSIASFVPTYDDGTELPAALAEGEWLVSQLGATAMEATYQSLTDFWGPKAPSETVTVLHFAGHGVAGDGGNAKLRLSDKSWLTCHDINSRVKLGRSFGTFMVINACEVATSDYQLGLVSGWAARLAERGFGGVLAPLWAVQDETASNVVRDYLQLFIDGSSIGDAMLKARAGHREKSSTPFAYVCHGDVMAKVTTKPTA